MTKHPDRVLDALTNLVEDGTIERALTPLRTWEWLVPLPPRDLSPNVHVNRWRKAAAVKQYRAEVASVVLSGDVPETALPHARLTLTAQLCRTKPKQDKDGWPAGYAQWVDRYHPSDTDNLVAACKALIDALGCSSREPGDATWVIANDRSSVLEHGAHSIVEVPEWRDEGVVIRLSEARP